MIKQTPKMPPPSRGIVVFGRPKGAAIPQGGWFYPSQVEDVTTAANKAALAIVSIDDVEDAKLLQGVSRGSLSPAGVLVLMAIDRAALERLTQRQAAKAAAADKSDAVADKSEATAKNGAAAVSPASAAATLPASKAVEHTAAVKAGAGVQPAAADPAKAGTPSAPSTKGEMAKAGVAVPATGSAAAPSAAPALAVAKSPWEALQAGDKVLAPYHDRHGDFEGWWEARIEKSDAAHLTLKWSDEPKTPAFTRRREAVALPPLKAS